MAEETKYEVEQDVFAFILGVRNDRTINHLSQYIPRLKDFIKSAEALSEKYEDEINAYRNVGNERKLDHQDSYSLVCLYKGKEFDPAVRERAGKILEDRGYSLKILDIE